MIRASSNGCFRYLLYCIYQQSGEDIIKGLKGIKDQPVEAVSVNGLCAAVSLLPDDTPKTGLPELERYGEVVSACHQVYTTIPLRYGSIFSDKRDIAAHLKDEGSTYQALVTQLAGNEEMGIRLLLPESESPLAADRPLKGTYQDKGNAVHQEPISGKAYLARQKQRYGSEDAFMQKAEKAISQWREYLKGWTVDFRWERPNMVTLGNVPLLSTYFLIRRQHIVDFKKSFHRICQNKPEKALLSGPWPPYNFVQQKKPEFHP